MIVGVWWGFVFWLQWSDTGKTRLQAEAGAVNAEGVLTSGARAGHAPKYKHFVDVARQIVADEGGPTRS